MPRKNYHHGDLKNALIGAGVQILSEEGIEGLSLRKVAQRAGVSHNAPYSHFPDKQSLIAAISTEGFKQLYDELDKAISAHPDDPKRQLQDGAWAYVQFALDHTDIFKIMFSGILEKEKDYPTFVEISQKTFARVVDVVQSCQNAHMLPPQPGTDVMAVAVWGMVHGIISLRLEGQISHTVLEAYDLRRMILLALDQLLISKTVSGK